MDLTDSRHSPTSQPARSRWLATGIVLAAALSAITGVISYFHGLDIAREISPASVVAYLLPLVPDLMIAMSSLVLFVASTLPGLGRPGAAYAALVAGIGWTVAQNVAAGWHQGWGGRLIDGAVPLAFVLTFELLLWLFRCFRSDGDTASVGEGAASVGIPAPLSTDAALQALLDSDTERKLAMLLRVDRNRIQAWKSQLAEVAEPAAEEAPEFAMNGSGAGA